MKLCIVGTGRSGTTLMWRMLDAHPDLFVFRETHWLPALVERFGATRPAPVARMLEVVGRMRHADGSPTTPLDPGALRARPGWRPALRVPEFCDLLAEAHAAAAGKRFWADKTPDYGYFIAEIQRLWPRVRVLHMIRDGADAAQSMARHPGYRALVAHGHMHWCPLGLDYTPPEGGPPKAPLGAFLDLWHDRLRRIRDESDRLSPGSYLEVRHEAVLADPRATLAGIADFAGLAAPDGWLDRAAGMIAADRGGARPRGGDLAAALAPRHRRLLAELGYDKDAE